MTLAVRDRAGHQRQTAERIEADFSSLVGRIGGLLDGVGDTDAAQHAAACRLLAPRRKASPVCELHGAVEVLLEPPAVIGEGERRLVGHRLRRGGVAAARPGPDRGPLGGGAVYHTCRRVRRLPAYRRRDKAMCNGCWSACRKLPHAAPALCKCRPPCRY